MKWSTVKGGKGTFNSRQRSNNPLRVKHCFFKKGKVGGSLRFPFFYFYGRFLTARMIAAPITTMATKMMMDIGMKYKSAIDGAAVAAGAWVEAGWAA